VTDLAAQAQDPPTPAELRRRKAARNRAFATVASVGCHALGAIVLFAAYAASPPEPAPPPPITLSLIQPPAPPAPPAAPKAQATEAKPTPAKPKPTKAKPTEHHAMFRHTPTARSAELASDDTPGVDTMPGLSDAEIAGAATAESGPPGGACDMARWLQRALRKDPLVHAAMAPAHQKAVLVWNGDWVTSSGEDGKGLAAVREAIMWEVGFAPAACRAEHVHGLVVLSLGDGAGARLAMGVGDWRWGDLVASRTPVAGHPDGR
jgi:hypothetical protein